ncbi:hypothetical protein P3W45_000603 [Vairimorpha bombi]
MSETLISENVKEFESVYFAKWEGIFKLGGKDMETVIEEVIGKYNNTTIGEYEKIFSRRYRKKFKEGQIVRVAKRENIEKKSKSDIGRFIAQGKVLADCEGDSL